MCYSRSLNQSLLKKKVLPGKHARSLLGFLPFSRWSLLGYVACDDVTLIHVDSFQSTSSRSDMDSQDCISSCTTWSTNDLSQVTSIFYTDNLHLRFCSACVSIVKTLQVLDFLCMLKTFIMDLLFFFSKSPRVLQTGVRNE